MPVNMAPATKRMAELVRGVTRSSSQPNDVEPDLLEAVHGFVAPLADPDSPMPREGPFGPPVPVRAETPMLDRVIGLTGRDPAWRPS